jgi:hypothetical protein
MKASELILLLRKVEAAEQKVIEAQKLKEADAQPEAPKPEK